MTSMDSSARFLADAQLVGLGVWLEERPGAVTALPQMLQCLH